MSTFPALTSSVSSSAVHSDWSIKCCPGGSISLPRANLGLRTERVLSDDVGRTVESPMISSWRFSIGFKFMSIHVEIYLLTCF